jgi:hypothetical protein
MPSTEGSTYINRAVTGELYLPKMRRTLKKLLLGSYADEAKVVTISHLERRRRNLAAIWEDKHHQAFGLEKILRLYLAASQFLFPGTYIKHYSEKVHPHLKDLSVDLLIVFKILLPLVILHNGWQNLDWLFWFQVYLSFETLMQAPTLIFASDTFSRPKSYTRSMLLVFLNYIELLLAFAVVYSRGHYLNHSFEFWYDSIYFSFTTGSTIGFGDYHPVSLVGKFLATLQAILFLLYVVIFMSFFNNKIEHRGYFDHTRED